jgi:hypothetical protein
MLQENTARDKMFELINKDSAEHHIEFKRYLSNHAAHLVIALFHLGVSAEEMEREYNLYVETSPLEPISQHWTAAKRIEITDDTWKDYLGMGLKLQAML